MSFTYDPSGMKPYRYRCRCEKQFYGDQCQHEKVSIHVRLKAITPPLASIVQYYDNNLTLNLIIKSQQVYPALPKEFEFNHTQVIAPVLGILKLYTQNYQTEDVIYSIICIQQNQKVINITTELITCPNALTLLRKIE
ncbi:unnamed protein product, partial [Didymodactylos carnosus]